MNEIFESNSSNQRNLDLFSYLFIYLFIYFFIYLSIYFKLTMIKKDTVYKNAYKIA